MTNRASNGDIREVTWILILAVASTCVMGCKEEARSDRAAPAKHSIVKPQANLKVIKPLLCTQLGDPPPSPLSILNLWVDVAELDAGLFDAESPVDAYSVAVAGLLPRSKL